MGNRLTSLHKASYRNKKEYYAIYRYLIKNSDILVLLSEKNIDIITKITN